MITDYKQIFRSKTYLEMFPDDEMVENFGHLTPSPSERNAFFFDCWMDWRINRLKLPIRRTEAGHPVIQSRFNPETIALAIGKDIGLRQFWDFQVKPGEVRFKDEGEMALFKINWDTDYYG